MVPEEDELKIVDSDTPEVKKMKVQSIMRQMINISCNLVAH